MLTPHPQMVTHTIILYDMPLLVPPDHQPLEEEGPPPPANPPPPAANGSLYYANNIFDILVFRNTSTTPRDFGATEQYVPLAM